MPTYSTRSMTSAARVRYTSQASTNRCPRVLSA